MPNPSGHRVEEVLDRMRVASVASESYPEPPTIDRTTRFKTVFAHSSTFVTTTHFLKSLFGMTIFTMPGGFHQGGLIFSAVGFFTILLLVAYNMRRLIVSAAHLSERENRPVRTYDEVAYVSFDTCCERTKRHASSFRAFINTLFFVTYTDACIILIVFVAKTLENFLHVQFPNSFLNIRHILFLQVLLLMGMSTLRDLKYLAPFSFVGCALFLCGFILVLIRILKEDLPSPFRYPYIGSLQTIFLFISISLYALSGISIALTIKSSMKHPEHFFLYGGVFTFSLVAVGIVFLSFGIVGYAKYGKETKSNIMMNLSYLEPLGISANVLCVASVFFSYPIVFYVAFNVIWSNYLKPKINPYNHAHAENFSRYCLVVLCFLIALAIPNLVWLIPLKGALFHSHLEVTIPALLDYVTFYPEMGNGKYHYRQLKAIFIMFVGTIVWIGGTAASLSIVIHDLLRS